jgi:hypothetical protein
MHLVCEANDVLSLLDENERLKKALKKIAIEVPDTINTTEVERLQVQIAKEALE